MFIDISDIKKSYGAGENRVEVLKGISFGVEKGEFCVLLGPSGSGKSTLLNIIGGIDDADSGYISINGEKIENMKEKALTDYRRRHLGYIFQMMNLIKWFGALFFIIVVYVLCKQVIERNFQSIAMTKILGFRNEEIGMLYIASTTIAVIVGLLISIPFIDVAMKLIVNGYLYTMMTGYLPLSMSPMTYVVMFFTELGCYIVVAFLQMRKVARVSKSEALKNAE